MVSVAGMTTAPPSSIDVIVNGDSGVAPNVFISGRTTPLSCSENAAIFVRDAILKPLFASNVKFDKIEVRWDSD